MTDHVDHPTKVEIDRETAAKLASVRFTIECSADDECSDQKLAPVEGHRQVLDDRALKEFLDEAGNRILTPFAEHIRKASRLRIQIPEQLIKIGIDVLQFEGEPLFVRLPVVYTIDQGVVPAPATLDASSVGLLISDRTADPDRAVLDVAKLFPRSLVHDAAEFDLTTLPAHTKIDFAIVSAHGRAGYEDTDVIALSEERNLTPEFFAGLRPQIVYLDSCNLGISLSYLRKMQSVGTNYVLAPIVSNEAGDSSTLTMNAVFNEIIRGRDPVEALHIARVQAHETYRPTGLVSRLRGTFRSMTLFFRELWDGGDPMVTFHRTRVQLYEFNSRSQIVNHLWRAFPFRIYALN